jgi:very-short-patch-repair endonuclease
MNVKEIPFERSFASHPKAEFWSNINNKIPREVYICSKYKFYFNCKKCNHEFKTSLASISNMNSWCPYCTKQKLCENLDCKDCFEKSFASHEKSIYWSNQNELNPRNIFKSSSKKYFFNCNKCTHYFEISTSHINENKWCSYCSSKLLCENKNCQNCFEKSFASHEKSKFWSNKNLITARQELQFSTNKYIFNCIECNHEFKTSLASISNMNSWCSYCSNKILCRDKNCNYCFKKSFASQEKYIFWSNKNDLIPSQVFKTSGKKYWFDCNKCNHEFETQISNITCFGTWCPYCTNQKLCNNTNCKNCFKNSFSSHNKSIYWSNENKLSPREVFISSNKKYIFNCNKCKSEFEATLGNIVCGNTWCPFCKNKTESFLNEWLNQNYQNVIFQPRFEWCKDKRKLPFDFLLENFKLIIELDGAQHFEQVSNWKSPEETQKVDKFKMDCALENGYSIIRIKQDDIWNNKIDWKEILTNSIKKYDTPIIILHYP